MTRHPFPNTFLGFNSVIDELNRGVRTSNLPYNIIEEGAEELFIELAVAGFAKEDISIEKVEDNLLVTGKAGDSVDVKYIHKGISTRDFTHKFRLHPEIVVKDANLINGILCIALEKIIPEEKKPQRININ